MKSSKKESCWTAPSPSIVEQARDFVGRFEALEAEYGRLLKAAGKRLMAAPPHLGHHRQAIPSGSAALIFADTDMVSREREARAMWETSTELRRLVEKVYAADYALLKAL